MESQCLVAKSEDFRAIGAPRTQMVPPARNARLLLIGALRAPAKLKRQMNSPPAAKQNEHLLKDG